MAKTKVRKKAVEIKKGKCNKRQSEIVRGKTIRENRREANTIQVKRKIEDKIR